MVRGIGGSAYAAESPLPEAAVSAFAGQAFATGPPALLRDGGPYAVAGMGQSRRGSNLVGLADGFEFVDIYLSAGPHQAAGLPSCDRNDYTRCALWRIRMELYTKTVFSIEEIHKTTATENCPGGRFHLQPTAGTDQNGGGAGRYAWQRTCLRADGEKKESSSIFQQAQRLEGIQDPNVVVRTSPDDLDPMPMPMYPNWFGDDTILYDSTSGSTLASTLWSMKNWTTVPEPGDGIGEAGKEHKLKGYEDPNTHRAPGYRDTGGQARIVTFGGDIDTVHPSLTQRIPRVTGKMGEDEEVFSLPHDWRPDDPREPECHHPAWNPDGTRILCTRYQDAEAVGTVARSGDPVTTDVRRLFVFEWDGGTWVLSGADSNGVAGALVEILTGHDFDLISRTSGGVPIDVFPPRENGSQDSEGCGNYVWKFAEWCASDRFLVATVYCTNNAGASEEALHSRVVLIDLLDTSSSEAYTDLVSFIEHDQHEGKGSYSGVFATCAPADAPWGLGALGFGAP